MSGLIFKTIVIGDMAVGKTSIAMRYVHNEFDPKYKGTIGVAHAMKKLTINDELIILSIWDTGGQEMFDYIRPHYFKGATCGLIIYDVTRKESFDHIERWFNDVKHNCGEIPIILIGNKTDLIDERVISTKEGERYAQQKKIIFYETSAKTGDNIIDVMEELVRLVLSNRKTMSQRINDR